MLAAVFFSIYRKTKGSRGTVRPSPLIRLLVRDGEHVALRVISSLPIPERPVLQLFYSIS